MASNDERSNLSLLPLNGNVTVIAQPSDSALWFEAAPTVRQAMPVCCGVAQLFNAVEPLLVKAYRVERKNPPAKYGVMHAWGGWAEIHIPPMVFGKYQLNHNLGASVKKL